MTPICTGSAIKADQSSIESYEAKLVADRNSIETAKTSLAATLAKNRQSVQSAQQGLAAFVSTRGNPYGHVILRGGARGPNYDKASVRGALDALRDAGLPERLIVDASHGNSERDHLRQPIVASEIAAQIAAGERGIAGVMIESFLVAGRQELTDPARLVYGQSITDACIGWDETVTVLEGLASAARERRSRSEGQRPRVASTKR